MNIILLCAWVFILGVWVGTTIAFIYHHHITGRWIYQEKCQSPSGVEEK